jgi:hypothetical protein
VRRGNQVNRAWQKCQKCGAAVRPGGGVLCRAHIKQAQEERIALGSIGHAIVQKRAGEMMDLVAAAADPDMVKSVTPEGENAAIACSVAADMLRAAWGLRIGRV